MGAVGRDLAVAGIEVAVPARRAGGDQRGGPARALVHVIEDVGVGRDQLLVGLEDDAGAVGRDSPERDEERRRSHRRGRWRPGLSSRPSARRRPVSESVSAARSFSSVSKNTRLPSREIAWKVTSCAPFPPGEPVEISVVAPPARSYTSNAASVSAAVSFSSVSKKARVPSADTAAKKMSKAPLPPVDPVESSVVVPPWRSYMSNVASVSPAHELLVRVEERPAAVRGRGVEERLRDPVPARRPPRDVVLGGMVRPRTGGERRERDQCRDRHHEQPYVARHLCTPLPAAARSLPFA